MKTSTILILMVLVSYSFTLWTGPGVVDKAFVFKDVYMEDQGKRDHVPLFQTISLSGDFGISFWVYLTDPINQEDVALGTAGGGSNINFFNARVRLYSGSSDVVAATTAITAQSWAHIAITRSGSDLTLYLNGQEEDSGNWSGSFSFSSLGGNGTTSERLLGKLDDVRVYSRALNSMDVQNLFNLNLNEPTLENELTHHWPLDDVREFFNRDPVDETFPFSSHWMGILDTITSFNGNSALADMDHDGDLDFVSGRVRQSDVSNNNMFWWEYKGPDDWEKHLVGTGQTTVASGEATDINGDGWADIVAGAEWYENPKNERTENWTMHRNVFPGGRTEDVNMGDLDGDGKMEFFFIWDYAILYKVASNPTNPAIELGQWNDQYNKPEGGSFGDLDGDGDVDIVRGERIWLRNKDGKGTSWDIVQMLSNNYASRVMTAVGDLDGDGDNDVAVLKHFGPGMAWIENVDGKGTDWNLHELSDSKGKFHGLTIADFDNDSDLDIFGGENMGQNYIWSNDGNGNFTEHIISVTARGHTARVGDIDCDGDLDIAGKPWEGGNHVFHRNLLVERGGTPLFNVDRGPYEGGFNTGWDCRDFISVNFQRNYLEPAPNFHLGWFKSTGFQKAIQLKGIEGPYSLSIITVHGRILKTIQREQSRGPESQVGFESFGKGPWLIRIKNSGREISHIIAAP